MMDAGDRELFRRSLRGAIEGSTGGTGDALDVALDDLGWPSALEADPQTAISLLFELQGTAHATSSALGRVVTRGLGIEGCALFPALGGWAPPGGVVAGRLLVNGLASLARAGGQSSVVVARDGDKHVAAVVSLGGLARRSASGIDPALGLVEVTGDAMATILGPADWPAAVALGQLALGHELVGAARRMLELAREHALERIQFGRPIATFQAVRHRLADTLVAIESADAVLAAAWEDRAPQTAAMAKALAGRGALTAARHCQQVLAGIGFTTDHPLHLYIRRVLVLDQLFGSARSLTRALGDDLQRSRQLPPLLPL